MRGIAKTFLRGLGVVVPFAFTCWLIQWLVYGAEALLRTAFLFVLPDRLYVPGLGVLSALVFILLVGFLIQFLVFDRLWNWMERLVDRIPLVKTVYQSARDLFGFVSKGTGQNESSVVRVAVTPDLQLIGLLTVDDSTRLSTFGEERVTVYFPMSYQLGGFAVIVPRSRVTALDWSVEEAMRFVLTAGAQKAG